MRVRKQILWKLILCTVVLLTQAGRAAALVPDSIQAMINSGDSCRALCHFNKAQSFYLRAYDTPFVKKSPAKCLPLLERIVRTHEVLRQWKELPEVNHRFYTLARECHDTVRASMALFIRGKRMNLEGQQEEGIRYCLQALERMKECSFPDKNHELANCYAFLTKMYMHDGKYDEAMRMSKEQERHACAEAKDSTTARSRRDLLRVQVIRIDLLAKMGRTDEADSLYRQYGIEPFADFVSSDMLPEYYQLRNMNDEALRFVQLVKEHIREDGDTMGRNMQRLLDDEGDIYFRMGQYQQAAECYIGVTRLADSLSVRSLRNISSEVRKVIATERDIARHRLILAVVIAGVLLLLVIIVLLLRHQRIVREKNRAMTATIHELILYRDTVLRNGDPVEMGENEAEVVYEEDLRRFKEADKRIIREKLFLQPDFGRDELMRLMGVDKNTLPGIVQRFAGTNVAGYVNAKRMEYAVALMKQHPEYTLQAICEACGIKSSTTFIRNFKNAYGITPSEFRKDMEISL